MAIENIQARTNGMVTFTDRDSSGFTATMTLTTEELRQLLAAAEGEDRRIVKHELQPDSVDPARDGYDYHNHAWVVGGKYQRCGHGKPCDCFGTIHAGEPVKANADVH